MKFSSGVYFLVLCVVSINAYNPITNCKSPIEWLREIPGRIPVVVTTITKCGSEIGLNAFSKTDITDAIHVIQAGTTNDIRMFRQLDMRAHTRGSLVRVVCKFVWSVQSGRCGRER